jgi:hypothetical protein
VRYELVTPDGHSAPAAFEARYKSGKPEAPTLDLWLHVVAEG